MFSALRNQEIMHVLNLLAFIKEIQGLSGYGRKKEATCEGSSAFVFQVIFHLTWANPTLNQ